MKAPNLVLGILVFATLVCATLLVVWDHKHATGQTFDHLLAVVAIFFGFLAVIYEWKLHRGFKEQRQEIQEIVRGVTTRYLGGWPDHLNEITDLINKVEQGDELLILVDHLGYGHYSRPEEYANYLAALEGARHRKAKVKILLYAEDAARTGLKNQFKEEEFEEKIKPNLKGYQSYYRRLLAEEPKNYEEFLTAALYVQSTFCVRLTRVLAEEDAIQVRTINNPQAEETCFWIIRRGKTLKQMVFAYQQFGGSKTGYGFITKEPGLMEVFSLHFDKEWHKDRSTQVLPEIPLFPEAHKKMSAKSKGADA